MNRIGLPHLLHQRTDRVGGASPLVRRRIVLAWMQIVVIALLGATLGVVAVTSGTAVSTFYFYVFVVVGMAAVMIVALVVNLNGWYYTSALLTVAAFAVTPWLSLIFDPNVSGGDLIPLAYVVPAIMLAAILLRPVYTIGFSAVQLLALMVVAAMSSNDDLNWASLLTLVLFTSSIAIVANLVTSRDVRELHEQAVLLEANQSKLREQAIRDPLTSLLNRRFLLEQLEGEVTRAEELGSQFGLIMADIDHFKNVNDDLGHPVGDAVLRSIAELIVSNVRDTEEVYRIGGDEFVILLPNATARITNERANDLVESVRQWRNQQEGPAARLTISAGGYHWSGGATTTNSVMQRADEALYEAKQAGKDRVGVARPL